MPVSIGRAAVQRLMSERDAQIAEVLPREEFGWAHLPGAVHLPLKELSPAMARERLVTDRPVIVYCNGTE